MDSMEFYSILRDGEYEIYDNYKKIESGTLLNGKNIKYCYLYDSSGCVNAVYHYILFDKDSVAKGFWGENSDYCNVENKVSYINQVWLFKNAKDYEIDSLNSSFYRCYLEKDTIQYGDTVFMHTYIPCVFYKEKQDSIRYLFAYTTYGIDNKERIQKTITPYSKFDFKPYKRGKNEIRFSITEINYTKAQNISYFGYKNVYVK